MKIYIKIVIITNGNITFVLIIYNNAFILNIRYRDKKISGGEKMPNIKSAKKRVKVTSTKHESNIPVKGSMKTAVKKVEKDASVENLKIANKRIDKARNKGIITDNKASRLKSRLAKKVNETK